LSRYSPLCSLFSCFFYRAAAPAHLPPFPTRRSSDLGPPCLFRPPQCAPGHVSEAIPFSMNGRQAGMAEAPTESVGAFPVPNRAESVGRLRSWNRVDHPSPGGLVAPDVLAHSLELVALRKVADINAFITVFH